MPLIQPDEELISGAWIARDGKVTADDQCERVHTLTSTYLLKLATDPTGWQTLFRDPADSRLWELTYPQGGLHGGGPPELKCVLADYAVQKYGEPAEHPIIFMRLLNEGTDAWRPIAVERLGNGKFRVLGPVPDNEEWEFTPGSIVSSSLRRFSNGEERLVAVSLLRAG